MNSGPHATTIAKAESSMMLTAVRRLCGQVLTGPSFVLDQSNERIIAPIVPPPAKQSTARGPDANTSDIARWFMRGW
jgi:hypothetical protein